MGWSSWYAYGPRVDQRLVEASYRKLSNRSVVPGANQSLQDVGYVFANIDDGWQACGAGVDGSFHAATGAPLVNLTKFPDVSAMTALAHRLGLQPGFYYNNYICNEGMPAGGVGGPTYMRNMLGSVDFLVRNRFTYIKIDSGSVYNNMQLWHDLIRNSSHPMVIENCHQGHLEPTATWCPYSLFRTSGDAHVVGLDIELLATAAALEKSRPDCWAYPDTIDAGTAAQARSQFGAYAVMSAPLILSFDILDDAKLLAIWDILTNREAIQVNQQWAGAPGKLVRKWSLHEPSAPLYPWAEPCNESDAVQQNWTYDSAAHRVTRGAPSGELMCLSSRSGNALALEICKDGSPQQVWVLKDGRLWQGGALPTFLDPRSVGILEVHSCNTSRPGQNWKLSAEPGHSNQTLVQNDLGFRDGGCWEITGCSSGEGAQVGVNYGCKPLPAPGWTDACDANGAWAVNPNGTITSVMDGHCLQVSPGDRRTVNVGACSGALGQRWEVRGKSVRSMMLPGMCVDSGIAAPPPGTTGRCASLQTVNDIGGAGAWTGAMGPALQLAPGQECVPDVKPAPAQGVSFGAGGRFRAGELCMAGRHGVPTPFGPLQLWAKPQPAGAVAVVVLNRAATGAAAVARVDLGELPGLRLELGAPVRVRDIWARRDLEPVLGSELTLDVPSGDSRFILLTPAPGDSDATVFV